MKIVTLNLDWCRKNRTIQYEAERILLDTQADIIVLTEAILLNLGESYNHATTIQLPIDREFEGLDYGKYLNGTPAFRTIIYSKYPIIQNLHVKGKYTSLAVKLDTEFGNLVIYGTIIGTWFNRKPYAEKELEECIYNCMLRTQNEENFILAGDLNTSFIQEETDLEIKGIKSRKILTDLFTSLKLSVATKDLKNNIDHIVVSNKILKKANFPANIFVEKKVISDHHGILVEFV